jgi:ADP-heptose:LPS heptosyltransferase
LCPGVLVAITYFRLLRYALNILMVKVLIIRFSSIGDIVLTTPVIRCLKKQVPGVTIHFAVKHAFRQVVESNPYIDKVHVLHDDLDELIAALQHERFDYVIDLHHNLRTLQVKRALKTKSFSFHKLNVQKWLLTNLKWNNMPNIHIVDRYLDTVASLGVKNDGGGLDYFIPADDKVKDRDIPTSHQAGYVGLVIGAAHATKRLPLHKLTELCDKIDHPVILLGGKEDYQMGKTLAALDPIKVYNACGKFNLNESADLVQRAKLIITHDTGLMHIAAAFKRPIVSIWGNTVPDFGMYPYYGERYLQRRANPFDIVEVSKLRCRPCSKIGYDTCPKGHFKCMEHIQMEALLTLVKERLKMGHDL